MSVAGDFRNEPLAELRSAPVRDAMIGELQALDRELPLRVPALIGAERLDGSGFESVDPGRIDRVVAVAAGTTTVDADRAVEVAAAAAGRWGRRSVEDRAAILRRGAGLLRRDRMRLAALVVRECGKPWAEADADVAEAIDFLEFYARQAMTVAGAELPQLPGERNTISFAPRGVAAVIAPWNFPIAIPTGMISAALVTGNSVVFKPAEQAPACGQAVVRALREAGIPDAALNLLPGDDIPAKRLVRAPEIATIAFTGSAAAGLEIMRVAGDLAPGQRHLKRVVAEMGGKNCVIVDSDADLDVVVPAVFTSAFSFAGQKCSAASRVLVHERIADALTERLAGSVESLVVGLAETFGVDVGPVIDRAAVERVESFVSLGVGEGRLAARGEPGPDGGFFSAPALLSGLPPGSRVLAEEIFGPVLAIDRVADVEAACEVVDSLPFALTGALFCRNPATVAAVAARSPVGNLYINRETTGAMVARQPFGGNRLSGNGTKAGGASYLLNFVDPRVVCENTMRHGLVVP
jgi:RHH-type proline utilization regulon transcriptional repressor/proline dehydrogenase/delta 1-pyrroline-5-carboxylate dehydrogenase